MLKFFRGRRGAVVFLTGCVLVLSACGGGGGGGGGGSFAGIAIAAGAGGTPPAAPSAPNPAPAPETSASRTVTSSVTSTQVGYAYPLSIYLPPGYDGGSTRYPVIYALDGDATNGQSTTRFVNLRTILQTLGTSAILVGVGGTERRQTDYNLPGSTAFHAFFANELIPFIEANYRADPARRMLTGLSTGGNFPLIEFLTQAPDAFLFKVYHSVDAAFWQQESQLYALEASAYARVADRPLPVMLILDSSSAGNSQYVETMARQIASRNYRELQLLHTVYSVSHVQSDLPSFEAAVRRAFP